MINMIRTDVKLNNMLMNEMGLAEGENHRIVDIEDGEICCSGTREIVAPGHYEKGTIEFDPINNPRMMNTLFMQFIDKLSEEESISGCVSFGTYQVPGSNKNIARLIMDSGEVIESRPYRVEGLCYVELVKRLNGEEDQDFTKYDSFNRKSQTNSNKKRR